MKTTFPYSIIILISIGIILAAFDTEDIQDKKVKAKFDDLVKVFFLKEDNACRQSALEEAQLTWTTTSDGGEEKVTEDSRLSKLQTGKN
jgi:hypothetical protein